MGVRNELPGVSSELVGEAVEEGLEPLLGAFLHS